MSDPRGIPDRRSGTYWLVVGGVAIAVYVIVLSLLAGVRPAVAVPVLVIDVLLSLEMVLVRLLVRPVVRRQWALAICLLVASGLSLAAVIVIAAAPTTPVAGPPGENGGEVKP